MLLLYTTPNPPTNIAPTNIAWVKPSGKSPMGLGIPPLQIKITLESNPRTSTMFIGRLGVTDSDNGTGNLVNTHSEVCKMFKTLQITNQTP